MDLTFETARVHGRLLADINTDYCLYQALYTNVSVMRHIACVMTAEEAAATFAKALKHNANSEARARYWHLSHRRDGRSLGLVALVRDSARPNHGELGMMLLPEAQRTGVGAQALTAVVDGLLSQRWALGIDVLLGRHATGNANAGRLVEHLGFDTIEIDMPDIIGWRTTSDAWMARLANLAVRAQYPR